MAKSHTHSRPAPDLVEAGIPATDEAPPGLDIDAVGGEAAPLDLPQGVEEWGTTAAEEAMGESLAQRVVRQEADATRSYDLHELEEALGNEDALSAEEAALRVVDEAPGRSSSPDAGYLTDGE